MEESHLNVLKNGVDSWNQWRTENPSVRPDLQRADLREMDLRKADFQGADLRKALLYDADLSLYLVNSGRHLPTRLDHADLRGAEFHDASFLGASLHGTDLRGARGIGANFRAADLTGAKLGGALLRGASFSEAIINDVEMYKTDFWGATFSKVKLFNSDLREANLMEVNFSNAKIVGCDLRRANLNRATLVETVFRRTKLTDCFIYGISVWNVTLDEVEQNNLVITGKEEPQITVDNVEVAQFIYLLVNYKNLRTVLDSVTKRGVLILGRFGGGGIEMLRALGEGLRQLGYLPIIFEFTKPEDRTYTETVRTLAGLARFVVVDLSGPSVPQELYATVPHLKIPFVPILEKGIHPYSMFTDLLEYDWVLRPIVDFDGTQNLLDKMPDKIVGPAEKRVESRQARLKELFG